MLVIPPFAEEMNKCRQMVTRVAMRLAQDGLVTVIPDLTGTGDSGGEFADADWTLWRDDLVRAAQWCNSTIGPVTAVLAIRLGCALACEEAVLGALPALSRSVFWQPVLDGSRHLMQFLRLRVAASMANDVKESITDLRHELASCGEVEIAGYRISRRLAAELEAVRVPPVLPAALGAVDWFEVVRQEGTPLPPATIGLLQASRAVGRDIFESTVVGKPFWAATEIVTNDELVRTTCESLMSAGLPAATVPQ